MAGQNIDSIERLQKGLIIALIAIVGILVVVLAWRQFRGGTELLGPITGTTEVGTTQSAGDVSELLANARRAMSASQLVSPAGSNAYEYYLAVLERQPGNPSAREALNDLYGLAVSSAEQAINAGDYEEAERVVGLLAASNPNSFTVVNLNQRVERARSAQAAAVAAAEAAAAAAATAAQQGGGTQQQQAEAAAAAAAATQAATTPEPAAPTPEPASDLASLLSPTAPPPEATPPPAPTPAPATTTTTRPVAAAPTQPTVRDARLLSRVNPDYPREAMRGRQEGWVEVEFTVGRDGSVSDIQVVAARPARIFDRAAIRAMQDWRFEPRIENGEPVATRLTQRFDFRLD